MIKEVQEGVESWDRITKELEIPEKVRNEIKNEFYKLI